MGGPVQAHAALARAARGCRCARSYAGRHRRGDVLYHFCCDAFHLRDWIASDLDTAVAKSAEALFRWDSGRCSIPLIVCADIANGLKHLRLDRRSYSPGGHAMIVRQQRTIHKSAMPHDETTWTITAGGIEYDGLELAQRAVADWDAWLATRRMDAPRT